MRWESVSILPFWICDGSAVVYDNKIHILGGVYDNRAHYSWDGTEWTEESELPFDFYNGTAVIYNNKIHILGYLNHYSWNGTQWTEESEVPQEDMGFGKNAVVYDNKIHILGMGNGYDAHYSWDGTEWTLESTLPEEFGICRAVVYDNKIHILGGSAYNQERTSHYSWNGTQWSEESELPCYFSDNAVVYDNKINILGTVNNLNYYYSWNGSQWIEASALPLPYDFDYGGSAIVYDNKLNILGGEMAGQSEHYELKNFNKIIFGLDSLIDLTGDTVTENDVAIGKTFHGPDGNQKIGTYNPTSITPSDSTPPSIASGTVIKATANGYLTESCYKRGVITTGLPTGTSQTYTFDTGLSTITELWVWINCSGNYENKAQLFVRYNSADGDNCYSIEGYQTGSTTTGQAGFFAFGASNIRVAVITAISGGSVTLRTGSQSSAYGNWSELRWMAR